MVRWELSEPELISLRKTLKDEAERLLNSSSMTNNEATRIRALGKRLHIEHLLSSLKKATTAAEANFDICCYCDTNYDFHSKQMSVSFCIGTEEPTHRVFQNISPPPDEYLGIIEVLKEMQKRGITGRVQVIVDASRCALALQMGMRYKVPNHSANQSPQSKDFGFSFDETIALLKELKQSNCHVEFSYRHRGYINEVLGIK